MCFVDQLPWGLFKKSEKQAGAELCQAQDKLGLAVLNYNFQLFRSSSIEVVFQILVFFRIVFISG